MAHISSIGAGIYTELAISDNTSSLSSTAISTAFTAGTIAAMTTLLGSDDFVDLPRVREFPAVGSPANIINVPTYGQSQSDQIQGQSDAPTLEFTVNYVPGEHNAFDAMAGDNVTRLFRMRLSNAELPSTIVAGTEHNDFYWVGTVASFQPTPNLTDSNQATLTATVVGEFSSALTTV